MSNIPENQIGEWLKKLERESWQLELLVSAFTIFLLIMGDQAFEKFLTDLRYQYNLSDGVLTFGFIFLGLLKVSLQALTYCLITHLMLRGFWIGAIGLRSVQSSIDFNVLKYNDFFTEKLKKKVISLDQLVFKLDEICSVIFAFAFLVISMLLSFGMYFLTFGLLAILFGTIGELTPDNIDNIVGIVAAVTFLSLLLSGIIYMIDYFTLGFFKKIKWLRKIYYPVYRFYSLITLAVLSRSIYYYMISKFTKKRIRILYGFAAGLFVVTLLFRFDQHQYFPEEDNQFLMSANYYDDERSEDDYVEVASIESQFIAKPYFQLFIRYNPSDNSIIKDHCPDFVPLKDDGLNWRLEMNVDDENFSITGKDYSGEDFEKSISCLSSIYEVSINDSIYQEVNYYFYEHPSQNQRGLLAMISTEDLLPGENVMRLRKVLKIADGDSTRNGYQKMALIPFWFKK